jgi:DNA-directed RNA polymerase subunit RPC12/RpoP
MSCPKYLQYDENNIRDYSQVFYDCCKCGKIMSVDINKKRVVCPKCGLQCVLNDDYFRNMLKNLPPNFQFPTDKKQRSKRHDG